MDVCKLIFANLSPINVVDIFSCVSANLFSFLLRNNLTIYDISSVKERYLNNKTIDISRIDRCLNI